MGIRTGQQFLDSLKDDRDIRIDGARVRDVRADPRFAGAAQSMAALFDLQHDPGLQDSMTYASPTSGEPVGLSFIEPRSMDDLTRRRSMIKVWMDATQGMFGRSPDFMNVHVTGFASAAAEFAKSGPQYGDNIRNYYEYCRENDLSLTHTLINPQVDRSRPVEQQEKDLAAKIVKETDAGIVVSGARMVATLTVFAHELMVMPSTFIASSPEAAPYAFGFAIPMNTPGLQFICRPSMLHTEAASPMDYPLSFRLDESDSMVIFDNVLVPWERVFIHRDADMCNGLYPRTRCMSHMMHQFCTKNLAKAEFMMGLGFAIAKATKIDVHLHVQGMLSELINFTEFTRGLLRAAEADAEQTPFGTMAPDPMPLWTIRMMYPKMFVRMCEIIQIMGAGGLVAVPSYAEIAGAAAENVTRYFQAAEADSASRIKLYRLAFDAAMSSFSGRQQLYERYYSGDPARLAGALYGLYDKDTYMERIWALLDDLEQRRAEPGEVPHFKLPTAARFV